MSLGRISSLICLFAFSVAAQAGAPKHQELSPGQRESIRQHNYQLRRLSVSPVVTPARPFSELEQAGYLFFSTDTDFHSLDAKREMIRNLPDGTDLVLYAEPGSDKNQILSQFGGLIPNERIHVVELENATNGFWARDGLPVPAWSVSGGLTLVDAKYYYDFEPDRVMAGWFHADLIQHNYNFEGGNFMVNDKGGCLSVNNDSAVAIPDSIFLQDYGCKDLLRLPFVKGIGHADESVKFLGSNLVVTDTPEYEAPLKAKGYEVRMLPRPSGGYETYVNSLLVNGTVYVPIFNEDTDGAALDVYRAAGLKVVGIPTVSLSNDGEGSLHCITMTYPKVKFQDLLRQIGAHEL